MAVHPVKTPSSFAVTALPPAQTRTSVVVDSQQEEVQLRVAHVSSWIEGFIPYSGYKYIYPLRRLPTIRVPVAIVKGS